MLFPRIVITGCGNPLYADDGFGPEVIQQLHRITLPPGVKAIDAGTGAPDFVFSLLDPIITRHLIVVDAARFGEKPGTVRIFSLSEFTAGGIVNKNPGGIAEILMALREKITITLVACQPGSETYPQMVIGLSPAVRNAIPRAVRIILYLIMRDRRVQMQHDWKSTGNHLPGAAKETAVVIHWADYRLFPIHAGRQIREA